MHPGSGGVRVVKLLACGPEGLGSIPGLATWISEMLLPSRDMAEILLKRRKSTIQLDAPLPEITLKLVLDNLNK